MVDKIKMVERRFDFFPAKFFWRGRLHQIEAVNECKTITGRWGDGTRHHFWVRCNGQVMHLCEALPAGDWRVYRD